MAWRTYDLIWVLPEVDLETGVETNSFVWKNIQGDSGEGLGS